MAKPKIKEWITTETRISLFQTAMNNSGRNFQGKSVSVKKMAEFAGKFYKIAMNEVEKIGELSMQQLKAVYKRKRKRTTQVSSDKNINKMIAKIAKKRKIK